MASIRLIVQRGLTTVVVLAAAAASWASGFVPPTPSSMTAVATVSGRDVPRVAPPRPLAFTSSGLVSAMGVGRLGLTPVTGGSTTPLATYSGSVGQAWGCGASFVGLVTTQVGQDWRNSVVWVDTTTHRSARRVVPLTQRVLGASPRGFVVADSATGATVEVVGSTGARIAVAPFADSWACDSTGYAWSESQVGAWTEKAYRRSWSAVTATPSLLVESERTLRVLSLAGGAALVSDSHVDGYTTRPVAVSLLRVAAGTSPAVLWSGSDAVLEGAVASGTNTYLRVTDRTSGSVVSRTLARDGSGSLRSIALPLPGPASPTPLAGTTGGGAVIGVGGAAAGLYSIGGASPVRTANWSVSTSHTRGSGAR